VTTIRLHLFIFGALALLALPAPSAAQEGVDIAKRTLDSGIAFYRSGDYKQALQDFMTVINGYSDSEWVDEALLNIARYYYEIEGDLASAREKLQQITLSHAASNSTPAAYYYLGFMLFDARRSVEEMRDGLANLERVVRLFPESDIADDALYQASLVHSALGEHGDALEKLQRLLLQYPESGVRDLAQFEIGSNFMFMDNILQAMVEYQQVRNLYPDSPMAAAALDRLTLLYRLYFSSDAGLKPFSIDRGFALTGAMLRDPTYLLASGSESVYVADRGLNRILKVDIKSGGFEVIGSSRPDAIALTPAGQLVTLANRQLWAEGRRLDLLAPGTEPPELLNAIEAFSIGPQGQYYVWDKRRGQILSYRADLGLERAFPSGVYKGLRDIAVDRFGDFFVLDSRGKRVIKYSPSGKRLKAIGPRIASVELRDPSFISVDDANNLYILDRRQRSIYIINPAGELILSFQYGDLIRDARGLAVDSSGAVYVADRRQKTLLCFK